MERALRLERALREIDRSIIEQADLGQTMQLVCQAAIDVGFRLCWVGLKEPDGSVRGVAAAGAEPGYLSSVCVRWDDSPEGRGPPGSAIRAGAPYVCERIADDPQFEPWRAAAVARAFGSSASCPLLSADREALGALNAYRTEAGPFSEELLRALETLAGQCTIAILSARRQQALRDAERQLAAAQRMEAVGTLAGGIAHDFNNLLTGIVGFAQVLRERLAGDAEAASDLDEILCGAERAAALTHQLLAFARRQPIAPALVDVNTLVGDLTRFLRRVVGEHIEVAVDLAPALPPVRVDPGQIEQVVMNLCVNARDAMPVGGTLQIETRVISAGPGLREVALRVSDTGVGIPAHVREHVFEPFFTTKATGRGTGLGLAVSYGIVKQHGGSITFESEPGRGTRFEIRLPAAPGVAEVARAAAPAAVRGGSERILVADDEPLVRVLAERVLSALGYEVILAEDGADAVEKVRALPDGPDLVVLDVVMPRRRGPDALEEMRRLRPGLRAVFMSGYDPAAQEPLRAGVPLLAKPFGPAALARKVRELLDVPARESAA
jgi:signal transduction histidine kinase